MPQTRRQAVRNFTVIDCAQHLDDNVTPNPEWLAARIARVTGSAANDMLAEGKGLSRRNLKMRLVAEHMTGKAYEKDFQSRSMEQGLKREPDARLAYERRHNVLVQTVGFISHNELFAGCSPDGYIGNFEGLVSIKCPELPQHLEWLRGGVKSIDLRYRRQIEHELFVTGALWTDFVSYNPEIGEKLDLVVIRVERDDVAIAKHEAALRAFLAEVEAEYLSLKIIRDGMGAVA